MMEGAALLHRARCGGRQSRVAKAHAKLLELESTVAGIFAGRDEFWAPDVATQVLLGELRTEEQAASEKVQAAEAKLATALAMEQREHREADHAMHEERVRAFAASRKWAGLVTIAGGWTGHSHGVPPGHGTRTAVARGRHPVRAPPPASPRRCRHPIRCPPAARARQVKSDCCVVVAQEGKGGAEGEGGKRWNSGWDGGGAVAGGGRGDDSGG